MMKSAMTIRVALTSLLLVLGSFSSVSGFYSPNPPQPPHPIDEIGQVIEGILGNEARERWIGFVFGIGVENIPPSATIFFPTGKDIPELWIMEPQIIRYHIVPRAISYWQLSKHSVADNLLPTLLPYMSINVTGDTVCNGITVDNVPITHPEMFNDGFITIHGVSSLLFDHYLKYGGPKMPSPPPHTHRHKHVGHKHGGHKHGGHKMPSPAQTQPHNQDNNEDQPPTFPFEMPLSVEPPSNALSAPAPQPSASEGTSIKQVSIALLVGVWAALLS